MAGCAAQRARVRQLENRITLRVRALETDHRQLPGAPPPQAVATRIAGDAQQPWLEAPRAVELVAGSEHLEKSVLRCLFCVLRATENAHSQSVNHRLIALHQLCERVQVSGLDPE